MLAAGHLRFVFAIAAAMAQPPDTGVIGGIVIDSSTGDPVRKAIVTVTWDGEPRSWATARTSSDGRFRFEGLPAGKYSLRAEKQRVGSAVYGADHVGETGVLIPLADGQTRDDLKLRFLHASSISGRVVDPDGDPVSSSNVILYRPGRDLGEQILVSAGVVPTNDRGEYRFSNVRPGRYYISAPLGYPQPEAGLSTGLITVFNGDTPDWKNSSVLTIRDGESLTGIDLRPVAAPLVHLHGHITGIPDLATAPEQQTRRTVDGPGVVITVAAVDRIGQTIGLGSFGPNNEFGSYSLPQGRYQIEASTSVNGKTYATSQIVDLQPGIGDLDLALAPATDLKGRLTLEGGKAEQLLSIQIILLRRYRREQVAWHYASANGNFTINQLVPGEYELRLDSMPRGSYLKSVMLGDKDVRFQRFEIESGSDAALNIVVSMNTAKIHGEIDSPQAGILLAPVGKFHDFARFYYAVDADDDGKFKMDGITPGKYKIFALERLSAANYCSPEAADALDALIDGGAPIVDLAEGASVEVHPRLIPFERAREVTP